ncbi:hypothetical protein Adt_28424 [Abeliophyllum distichum]|uniref:Uncharacterized protein n=1 Tax=Abeliophyllum distichum TaxID=126358 RepID=A0ABD1RX75_9LAMI
MPKQREISRYKRQSPQNLQRPTPMANANPQYLSQRLKNLLRHRLNNLSLLQPTFTRTADIAATSIHNPNPYPGLGPGPGPPNNVKNDSNRNPGSEPELCQLNLDRGQILDRRKDLKRGEWEKEEEEEGEIRDEKLLEGEDCLGKLIKESCALVEEKNGNHVQNENKTKAPNKENDVIAKEKRKKEVKEKLEILNEKKHSLVQVLKQILNAEEELKRQSSMQGMAGRQFPSLLVDTTNDSGSMTRLNTPRTASDGNLGGDMDVGEADDAWNHNVRSCNVLRLSSTSPSSDSQLRKPACNAVPHASRAALGAVGSPSRFAPTGQQGHSSNLPSVSVSGTNYIASSPSPAASGGTSVFRDGRLPSPWN